MRIRRILRDLSIKYKIGYAFALFFLILILLVTVIIRQLYYTLAFNQMIQQRGYDDLLITKQLERVLESVNACSNNVIVSLDSVLSEIQAFHTVPDITDTGATRKILHVIDNSFLLFSDVKQISILYENGSLYRKEKNGTYHVTASNYDLLNFLEDGQVDTLGQWMNRIDPFPESGQTLFYYVKVLRDISINRPIGYVILGIEEASFYNLYHNENAVQPVEFYLFGPDEQIWSSSNRDMVSAPPGPSLIPSTITDRLQDEWTSRPSYIQLNEAQGQWTVLSVTDTKAALSDIDIIIRNIFLFGIGAMVLFFILTLIISSHISRPITRLSDHMVQFDSTLPQKIPSSGSSDEIGVLINSYNTMIEQNSNLFRCIQEEQQAKNRLEFALLQSQIKPHFLYNTLDTIYCLNGMKRSAEAARVTKLLADYYRLMLNRGEEWNWLDWELEAAKKYLEIQSVRYQDVLSYEITMPDDMIQLQLPKLSLQPLIENAIYHGIKPTGRSGKIWVTGERNGPVVVINVIDNGAGMSDGVFASSISKDRGDLESDHFGLHNVAERLNIFYGGRASLLMRQDEQLRTVISIRIDWEMEEPDVPGTSC